MGRSHRRAAPPAWAGSVAGVEAIDTHRGRIAAALAGALAAERARSSPGTALEMLAVAESLASTGSFEVDDLRRRGLTGPPADGPVGLLVRVLPFGLSTPLDRPRLRRDAYRCAAAAGADEGTTVACIGAALVIADLLRFDPAMTAIRVRQSLLEDAPMALLDRLTLLDAALPHDAPADDPGAAIQLALSVQASVGE